MRFIQVVVMALAVATSGCGGGGGGIRPEPPGPPDSRTCLDGSVIAADSECPVATGPLPGIERIPKSAVRASNSQMAGMYGIMEYNVSRTPGSHAELMAVTACESYIMGCDSGEPFTLLTRDDIRDNAMTLSAFDLFPSTTKVVSQSTAVGPNVIEAMASGDFTFALIHSAGNNPDENGIDDGSDVGHLRNVTESEHGPILIQGNRMLFVAGYALVDGQYVRDPSSVSCEGVEQFCLYAPYTFITQDGQSISGTSVSAPQVASALASVLALFPDTASTELVRLAKACAVAEPGLEGLGRADFTCMTVMDESGEWRVVGVDDVISPMAMHSMRFPGQTSVSGTFENADGEGINLGLTSLGMFQFTPGVPVITDESVTGFFPMLAGDERNFIFGVGYATEKAWFARLSYGERDAFFGLGRQHGYDGSIAVDADVGHRNLFARVSWQSANGSKLIRTADGTAFGLGMQRDVYRADTFSVSVSGSVSKFLGGSAETVFGDVDIGESQSTREVATTATYAPHDSSMFEVSAEHRQFGSSDDVGIKLHHTRRF